MEIEIELSNGKMRNLFVRFAYYLGLTDQHGDDPSILEIMEVLEDSQDVFDKLSEQEVDWLENLCVSKALEQYGAMRH